MSDCSSFDTRGSERHIVIKTVVVCYNRKLLNAPRNGTRKTLCKLLKRMLPEDFPYFTTKCLNLDGYDSDDYGSPYDLPPSPTYKEHCKPERSWTHLYNHSSKFRYAGNSDEFAKMYREFCASAGVVGASVSVSGAGAGAGAGVDGA